MKPRNEAGPQHGSPSEPIPSPASCGPWNSFIRVAGTVRVPAAAIKAGLPVYRWQKRLWISTDDLISLLMREGATGEQDDDAADGLVDSRFSGNGCGGTTQP